MLFQHYGTTPLNGSTLKRRQMTTIKTSNTNQEIASQNFSVDILVDGFFGKLDYQIESPELSAEARKYAEMVVLNELIFGSPMVRDNDGESFE